LTETDTSPAGVHHWDGFWRAREKAVQQEDIGSRDPAPAEYWDTFFRKEFESVRQPRLLDVACGVGAVTTIALRAARATTTDLAAYCADYSVSAVAELRKSVPEATGVACDARALPYSDCSFDLVVSQFGIEYAGMEAFDEAARLVDAGNSASISGQSRSGALPYITKSYQPKMADPLALTQSPH
jgi:ubiquinone/menaquinone biosynthesis C-methylase UbiE